MHAMPTPAAIQSRRAAFRALHTSGCFLIPNPWDVGSARYLANLGFKALATTSSGAAWAGGLPDGGMPLAQVLEHLRHMVAATGLPINADFEKGFADDPEGVARHVREAVDTGIAGVSIEDSTGNAATPQFEFALAVERMRAARAAIDASGQDVLLIGCAENFFVGRFANAGVNPRRAQRRGRSLHARHLRRRGFNAGALGQLELRHQHPFIDTRQNFLGQRPDEIPGD